MKKIVAALLLLLYFFGATEAYQLCKLPKLVQHYRQHKAQNAGMSFVAFMKEHYAEKMVIDDDFQQDMQLPFKTHNADSCNVFFATVPAPFFCISHLPVIITSAVVFSTQNEQVSYRIHPNDVFQPPKLA